MKLDAACRERIGPERLSQNLMNRKVGSVDTSAMRLRFEA